MLRGNRGATSLRNSLQQRLTTSLSDETGMEGASRIADRAFVMVGGRAFSRPAARDSTLVQILRYCRVSVGISDRQQRHKSMRPSCNVRISIEPFERFAPTRQIGATVPPT